MDAPVSRVDAQEVARFGRQEDQVGGAHGVVVDGGEAEGFGDDAEQAILGLVEGFEGWAGAGCGDEEAAFDGSAEIGEVRLGGVVHEAGHFDGGSGCTGVERVADADAVLGDGVEVAAMALEPAGEGERVRDVGEINIVNASGEGIDAPARESGDASAVHGGSIARVAGSRWLCARGRK